MAKPVVIDTEKGKRVEVELPANRLAVVSHTNRDFQEVADKLIQQMEEANSAAVQADALEFWKERKAIGEADMPENPFDPEALVAWYLSHADYESRWQKEDRIKAEREAAEAAAKAEREAKIAEAGEEEKSALAALFNPSGS